MRTLALVGILFIVGCNDGGLPQKDTDVSTGDDDDDDDDDDVIDDTDTDTDTDTSDQVTEDEQGSLVITHRFPAGFDADTTVLHAVFSDSRQGIDNLAECFPDNGEDDRDLPCIDQLPSQLDDYVVPTVAFQNNAPQWQDMGPTIKLGFYPAERQNRPALNAQYYFGRSSLPYAAASPVGLEVDGDWGTYIGTGDLTLVDDIVVTTPDPQSAMALVAGSTVDFAWVVGGGADVYLHMESALSGLNRYYLLDDDGEFSVDVDDLNLDPTADDIVFRLGRVSSREVVVNGRSVQAISRSEQVIEAAMIDISGRDPIQASDTCLGASGLPSLGAGSYYGNIGGFTNDLEPDSGCTGFGASGHDGIVKITLQQNERVTVSYELLGEDSSVYLLADPCDPFSCLAGADSTVSTPEELSYTNGAATPTDVYLILDGYSANGGALFFLDLTFDTLVIDPMPDTCAQAEAAVPVGYGQYVVTVGSSTNDLDPTATGCTGVDSPFADNIVPLSVPANELVTITASDDNVSLYLVSDCALESTCVQGAQQSPLIYLNDSGAHEDLFLVIDDTLGTPSVFDLTINGESVVPAVDADNCADAGALPLTGPGTYVGNLGDKTNTLDPTLNGCTGDDLPEPEALLKLEIAPGELLTAEVPDFYKELYLLADCFDTNTCVAGSAGFDPELFWLNTGTQTETVYLVVDASSEFANPIYELTVDIVATTPLDGANTCAEAQGLTAIAAGEYWSDLSANTNDMDPTWTGCTNEDEAGPDAFAPVRIEDGEMLIVDANGIDAAYFVTDCTTPTSCEAGDHDYADNPRLTWLNSTGTAVDGYIVFDDSTSAGTFSAEVVIQETTVLVPADTCATIGSLTPITTGSYLFSGDLSNYTDDIDPGSSGCTGYTASGEEGVVTVELQYLQTIDVSFDGLQDDGSVYLLETCTDTTTCVAGDDSIGGADEFSFTNTTGAAMTYSLVLDGFLSTGQFLMELEIRDP